MESLIEKVKELKSYLNLNFLEKNQFYILEGPVVVKARFDDYSICKSYVIQIVINKLNLWGTINDYKYLIPRIYALKGIDKSYSHLYPNDKLCLDADYVQYAYLLESDFDLIGWYNRFFLAFTVEYEYFKEYGYSLGMERSHGAMGILEAIVDILNIPQSLTPKFKKKMEKCNSLIETNNVLKTFGLSKNKMQEIEKIVTDYLFLKEKYINEYNK